MNRVVHKFCAWSGTLCLITMGVGFMLIAGFIPTRSPSQSVVETAQFIIDNRTRIRWGMILCMFSSSLLMTFAVSMAIHMRRIEGRFPALAMIQFGLGAIFVLEFIYLIFFWQTATFRVDRAPELIQLLNDMAWIPFVGLSSTLVVQVACVRHRAVLMDRRDTSDLPALAWLLQPLGGFDVHAGHLQRLLPGRTVGVEWPSRVVPAAHRFCDMVDHQFDLPVQGGRQHGGRRARRGQHRWRGVERGGAHPAEGRRRPITCPYD